MSCAGALLLFSALLLAATWAPSQAYLHGVVAPGRHRQWSSPPLIVRGGGRAVIMAQLPSDSSGSSSDSGMPDERNLIYQAPIPQFVSPPPPDFRPKSLPIILAGGLLLFASSPVSEKNKPFAKELLQQAQNALNADPTITMELGQNLEAGGIYAAEFATRTTTTGAGTRQQVDQLVLQFQIEGGNAWAQGVAYGIQTPNNDDKDEASSDSDNKSDPNVQLVSLEVANMDASINGTPLNIPIVPRQ